MARWLQRERISPPDWPLPHEPIMHQLQTAFEQQRRIGWDQFFRGRIAIAWKYAIRTYYAERRPGDSFTPDQWMRTTIKAIWDFSMTLWRQRNAALHGENGTLSKEKTRRETAARAAAVYQETLGTLSPSDSHILHRTQIATILNWTKQHLDAYLATAEVICEWNVEPG
jgi:hypothetical protein